jgi:hypothetical protein
MPPQKYLINHMNTYPLTHTNREHELILINEILKNNGYQQQFTTKSPRKHPQTPQNEKTNWATFTYFGPDARTITNLFQNTNIKIAYKTTNSIGHILKPKKPPVDIYNMSGIYQLQCGECPLKYIGQTGRTFKARYREHINAIKVNKQQHSKFVQYILEITHTYDTIDRTMKVLHIEKKEQKLNTLEKYHIYNTTKKGPQLNDTFTNMDNPIFDVLIKYSQ